MSLREALLPVAAIVRSLASPTTLSGGAGLDVWINSVRVRKRTWSGGKPGLGTPVDTDVALVPNPEIRQVSQREVVGSGGRYTTEDLMVQHITPAYTKDGVDGGYSPAMLVPDVTGATAQATEVVYVVEGPLAGEYVCVGSSFQDPIEYKLTLRRRRTTPK